MSETNGRVFTIDGNEYPIPTLASFTMDEAVVFYSNCGYPVEDLWLIPNDDAAADVLEKLRSPSVVKTLLHVAYRRGNVGVSDKRIGEAVGRVPLVEALTAFLSDPDEVEGDDALPPARTSEQDGSSPPSSLDETSSSGSGSESDSGQPDRLPSPTGTIRSGTSRTSDPVMSEA